VIAAVPPLQRRPQWIFRADSVSKLTRNAPFFHIIEMTTVILCCQKS